jgi:hypothetical protein
MDRIVHAEALDGYRLRVTLADGTQGEVALADRLFGPVFEPLQDPAMFARVFVDEFGAVCWPNGADLAPDSLCQQIRLSGTKQRFGLVK